MKKYPKIQSIFKREPQKPRDIIMGEYAVPELETLKDIPWDFTEKFDGTNICISWDGVSKVEYGGRTDRAILPKPLLAYLKATFTPEIFRKAEVGSAMILYGEGYGKGIQKGGNYRKDQGFILFDVFVYPNWWLLRKDVDSIAAALGIPSVPVLITTTLEGGIEYVKTHTKSTIGTADTEGVVGRPKGGLLFRNGTPIMVKIKNVDFK